MEMKAPEAPEKSLPRALAPTDRQLEGEDGTESPGAESLRLGSSVGSPTVREGPEDGPDSTISEAATLPWGTDPQYSVPLPDPPGWRDIEPEPLELEPLTKSEEPLTKPEEPLKDDASLLPEKSVRAFVPIDLQCIERRPQEECIVQRKAGQAERRNFLPTRLSHHELPERKWAEAVVRPPGRSCGGCGSCGGREALRAVASVAAALIFFPCLLYGAYAFLPFDAPRLPTMSSRLIYTLRCGVFATFPIVLGESRRWRRVTWEENYRDLVGVLSLHSVGTVQGTPNLPSAPSLPESVRDISAVLTQELACRFLTPVLPPLQGS